MCRCEQQQGWGKPERISGDHLKSRLCSQQKLCSVVLWSVYHEYYGDYDFLYNEKMKYAMGIVWNIVFGNKLSYYYNIYR
jgi:hypothetical protein